MIAIARRLSCGLGVAAALAVAAPAASQTALKFGHIVGTDHPIHIGATAMAEHVARCSNGQLKIDIFPGGQLGSEAALNDQIRIGGVDFANSGAAFFSRDTPHLGISSVPYVFRNRDHAIAYVRSDVLRELMDAWDAKTGQIMLAAYYSAAFHVYGQEPFQTPDQIKGKKIRVPDAPAWMVFYRAVGATPVPMALGEVYLGLRQGVVDGTNMPLAVGFSTKLHEVTKVLSMTGHQMEIAMLITGAHVKRRLPAEQWKCVQEGGAVYGQRAQAAIIEGEDSLRDKFVKENLIRVVDVDVPAYQKATASLIDDKVKAGEFPQALVDRIRAIR
jgi:tripartite ATP-independent transporter DctP family solute receptor